MKQSCCVFATAFGIFTSLICMKKIRGGTIMVKVSETEYKKCGKCLKIENGSIKLIVTLEFGPRIINFSTIDGENMMFEDEDFKMKNCGKEFDEYFYEGAEWHIRGGHRLWASPEELPRTYYPDNEPCDYEKIENGARIICRQQIKNNNQYTIDIVMSDNSSEVKVIHKITNKGAWTSEFAAWAISMTAESGMVAVPVTQRPTGLLPNRAIALWPYSKMTDSRAYWGDKFLTFTQDPDIDCAFKMGINNEDGYMMVFNHGCLFVKKNEYVMGAEYPDGGMSIEVYIGKEFLEAETLSPLYKLKPGETIVHTEEWSLFDGVMRPSAEDEKALEEIASKYV